MTYERDGYHYVKRRLPGLGRVEKSLRTQNASRARRLEEMLLSLCDRGRLDLVRSWADGELEIVRLWEAYEAGQLHELSRDLRRPDVSLEDAIDAVKDAKRADVAESTLERYSTGLDHFQRLTDAETVQDALTTSNVRAFKADRREEDAAQETINNDLGAVSVLATHAVERGWIDERPDIDRFETSVRVRYLDSGELATYQAHLRAAFRPLMQFLIGTGVRLGEAESLRVSDLRLGDDKARALIEDSKTRDGVRAVFVPPWAAETVRAHLEAHGREGADPVFDIPRRTVQKEHNRACGDAGIHDYTIHDHRHTAAVHLARSGLPLHLLQQQLGHSTIEQTMRYARFHPDYGDVGPYFERMGETLGLTGESGDKSGDTEDSESRQGAENESA